MKIEVEGKYIVILTTAPNPDVAQKLARELVTRCLVACVNIVPGVESIYRWQGQLESSNELLLVMKTTAAKQKAFGGLWPLGAFGDSLRPLGPLAFGGLWGQPELSHCKSRKIHLAICLLLLSGMSQELLRS